MRDTLEKLLTFTRFTHELHRVTRVARIPGEERYANVMEHTGQLAFLAWYLVDAEDLPLDREKVLMYVLAHDCIEAYAGDTYLYDEKGAETKKAREEKAREQIREEFPEFAELHAALDAYEAQEDAESRFVYALDKLIDPLNIYLEDGHLWKEVNVTYSMLMDKKKEKVRAHDTINTLFAELTAIFEANESQYFPPEDGDRANR